VLHNRFYWRLHRPVHDCMRHFGCSSTIDQLAHQHPVDFLLIFAVWSHANTKLNIAWHTNQPCNGSHSSIVVLLRSSTPLIMIRLYMRSQCPFYLFRFISYSKTDKCWQFSACVCQWTNGDFISHTAFLFRVNKELFLPVDSARLFPSNQHGKVRNNRHAVS